MTALIDKRKSGYRRGNVHYMVIHVVVVPQDVGLYCSFHADALARSSSKPRILQHRENQVDVKCKVQSIPHVS